MAEPKRNTAFTLFTALGDVAGGAFVVNPTIAAGDFRVSIDGGAFANLATLPVVSPVSSQLVKIDLSAVEMNGDSIQILGVDVAGAQWADVLISLDLPVVTVDDIWDALFNDSIVVVGGGGLRTITVFEDDGSTEKAKVQISGDGLTRTKLPPTP